MLMWCVDKARYRESANFWCCLNLPASVLISLSGWLNFPFCTPTVDLLHVKAPVVTNLEGGKFMALHQSKDSGATDVKIIGDFLHSENTGRWDVARHSLFLYQPTSASAAAWRGFIRPYLCKGGRALAQGFASIAGERHAAIQPSGGNDSSNSESTGFRLPVGAVIAGVPFFDSCLHSERS